MDPALGVHESQARGCLLEQPLDVFLEVIELLLLELQPEAAGHEKLHHEIGLVRFLDNPDDLDDVGMAELFAHFRLVEQQPAKLLVADFLRQQRLDGKVPAAGHFDYFPNLAVLASHQMGQQAVSAQHV